MCGICGIAFADASRRPELPVLEAMNATLTPRGPDEDGFHTGPGVGLAMRRLKIIDLEGGRQPIRNETGEVTVVFNGEIYDFSDLRGQLEGRGHTFSTRTDTEVIVHLYEDRGEDFLQEIHGMFAIALWDERSRRLVLARDRAGKKPLYYTLADDSIIFGSELKALLAHPAVSRRVDPLNLARYLHHEYVPAPHSILEGVFKLPPAHVAAYEAGHFDIRPYWDLPPPDLRDSLDEEEVVRDLRELFDGAVRRRLVSDVPLGIFLSGGIDSSTVTYFASRAHSGIKTFNISFQDPSFDESSHAGRVARELGTDHHEQQLSPGMMMDLVPEVAGFLDEPLGDASILPTYLLSRFTREHVTVALGGDGGDELFGGYPTYQAHMMAPYYEVLPAFIRNGIIRPLVDSLPVSTANISLDFQMKRFVAGAGHPPPLRNSIWLGSFAPHELDVLHRELRADLQTSQVLAPMQEIWERASSRPPLDALLYLDTKLYLQDDILVKVDRATMANSLEARAPLLDTRVMEYIARIPACFRLAGLTTKRLMKKAMEGLLPREILDRPKKGFGVPIARWARQELKPLFLDLLSPARLEQDGFFDPRRVGLLLDEHFAGRKDHRKKLWTLLVFQLWHRRWIANAP